MKPTHSYNKPYKKTFTPRIDQTQSTTNTTAPVSQNNPTQGAPKSQFTRNRPQGKRFDNRAPRPRAFESKSTNLPSLLAGNIRIVPVGGVEGIGANMTFIEMNNEIIIIDVGFAFSNPDTPGVDYILPNITYLKENRDRIKAIVITHGHLDHVGGLPFLLGDLGYPPIFCREFGALFIKKKFDEFPHMRKKLTVNIIEHSDGYIKLTDTFKVKFFGLTHSIPDSTGVIVMTPYGGIVSTGDVRVENTDGNVHQNEVDGYSFFKNENILLCTMDSTGIEKPGWSISEELVSLNVDEIMKNTSGRLFIAAFSSQVERMMTFMSSAKKHGKYIAFEGRSIKSNMAIAQFLKLTSFSNVINIEDIDKHPDNKVVIIIAGGQGEEFAALVRVANESHRNIKLKPNDTIVLSSSIVPGNDYSVAQLKNNLFRGSYKVITYRDTQVHASGHGTREELLWIHKQIPYKFFMPVHGEPYMVRMHAQLAHSTCGVPKENILIPDNGSVIEIRNNGTEAVILEQKIVSERMVVDGTYIGPIRQVVLDDRKKLAQSGFYVVAITLDPKTGKLKKSPDIISRGSVYLRESLAMINNLREFIKTTAEFYTGEKKQNLDFDDFKKYLGEKIERYLFEQTGKEPIVIPVILSV